MLSFGLVFLNLAYLLCYNYKNIEISLTAFPNFQILRKKSIHNMNKYKSEIHSLIK